MSDPTLYRAPGHGSPRTRLLSFSALLLLLVGAVATVNCASAPERSPADLLQEGTQRLSDLVLEVVPDEERAARAQAAILAFRELETRHFKALTDHRSEQRKRNIDYDATREEFEALSASFEVQRQAFLSGTVELLDDLRGLLEPDEWDQVVVGLREADEVWEELGR